MKDKIKIYGIGNDKEFNHYTFEKTKKAHRVLRRLFKEVFNIEWCMEKEEHGDNDEPLIRIINIEEYKDFHEMLPSMNLIGQRPRIDIYYGGKRMYITILCPIDRRNEFNRKLNKEAEFIEVDKDNFKSIKKDKIIKQKNEKESEK